MPGHRCLRVLIHLYHDRVDDDTQYRKLPGIFLNEYTSARFGWRWYLTMQNWNPRTVQWDNAVHAWWHIKHMRMGPFPIKTLCTCGRCKAMFISENYRRADVDDGVQIIFTHWGICWVKRSISVHRIKTWFRDVRDDRVGAFLDHPI